LLKAVVRCVPVKDSMVASAGKQQSQVSSQALLLRVSFAHLPFLACEAGRRFVGPRTT